jgi:hypothetical protein
MAHRAHSRRDRRFTKGSFWPRFEHQWEAYGYETLSYQKVSYGQNALRPTASLAVYRNYRFGGHGAVRAEYDLHLWGRHTQEGKSGLVSVELKCRPGAGDLLSRAVSTSH